LPGLPGGAGETPHLYHVVRPEGQRLVRHRLQAQQETGHGGKGLMTIRPLHDRILVKRLAEQDKTAGGLYIPDTAKEKPIEAKVVAVGSGKRLEDGTLRKPELKPGDRVLFSKYSGSEVKIDGDEHLIMCEEDILAVIE
jgi:chaperonin GroES